MEGQVKGRVLLLVGMGLAISMGVLAQAQRKPEPAMEAFWTKFQVAVATNDKAGVAALTGFPLSMPYGVSSIKTKAQLIRNYNKIFDSETKRCFVKAKPEPDTTKKKRLSISCGEAMMYWFEVRNGEYKFISVDNVNE